MSRLLAVRERNTGRRICEEHGPPIRRQRGCISESALDVLRAEPLRYLYLFVLIEPGSGCKGLFRHVLPRAAMWGVKSARHIILFSSRFSSARRPQERAARASFFTS
jgi:hypothetical protein